MKKRTFSLLLLLLVLFSCSDSKESVTMVNTGGVWSKEQALVFTLPDRRAEESKEVFFIVRNNAAYPYQNLVLEVEIGDGTTQQKVRERITCSLTNDRGQWKGHGFGEVKELHYFYRKLPSTKTVLTLRHQMPRKQLPGIEDIGIKLKTVSSDDGK